MARKPDSHHVLPLWCDDLIASCVDMTPACFGAYMRLLCYAWTRGGVPDDEAACSRIAGGLQPGDWSSIRARLVPIANVSQCDRTAIADGSQGDVRLTHPRLELERQAVEDIRGKKSEAGKKGNLARWGSQTDRKAIAGGIANASQSDRKTIAPNPSPSLPLEEENTHTHGSDDFRQPGWAIQEWERFLAAWNTTERAKPWPHLSPPDGWVDLAATPGWLQRASEALQMLPSRRYFDQPLPVTRFFDYLDRIRAGEFAEPKADARGRQRQPAGGNL